MFTDAEYRRIRERSLADLKKLLSTLELAEPNWDAGDEFRTYEALDDQIVARLCRLMKSDTIINGYVKLLGLGGINVDYSETDNELLDKIIRNRNAIERGATQSAGVQSAKVESQPIRHVRKIERTETIAGLVIVGAVLIIGAIALMVLSEPGDSPIVSAILGIAGIVAAGLGFKGRTITEETTVEEKPAPRSSKPVSTPAPFTSTEIRRALDVLSQANKIVHSL